MPLTKWQPPSIRSNDHEGEKVGWLELFFDLIYVAALIQLGDELAADVSWSGIARFLGVFVVLWWTWTGTTAFMSRYAVDDVWHRLITFVQMFAVGNFAIVSVADVADRASWLVVAYLAARLPLLVMYLRARRMSDDVALLNTFIVAVLLSCAIWVVSLLVPTPARYVLWGVAILTELLVPLKVSRKVPEATSNEEYLRERYALFTIIVLGETFVKVLSELNKIGISMQTQVLGGVGFVILVALWWTYFDDVADSNIRRRSLLSQNPSINRVTWIYAHLPLAIGLTAFGVASKKIIGVEAFGDALKSNYSWLLAGALITVLLSVAVLDIVTVSPHFAVEERERVLPPLLAAAALLVIGILLATGTVTALLGLILAAVAIVAQIAFEVVAALKHERELEGRVDEQLAASAGECEHLAAVTAMPAHGHECDACVEVDQRWVQLRVCLICGHVGCCDDTPGLHARQHFEETGHGLIATIEPGGTWAYCYTHDVTDHDWVERHDTAASEH